MFISLIINLQNKTFDTDDTMLESFDTIAKQKRAVHRKSF